MFKDFQARLNGCKSIVEIPIEIFDSQRNGIKIDLRRTFRNCDSLVEIPDHLFDSLYVTVYEECFNGDENLERISKRMFGTNDESKEVATTIDNMFKDCERLTVLEDNIFEGFKNIKSAQRVFANNYSLTNVDKEIFKGCESIAKVGGMFYGCNNLTYVRDDIFDYCSSSITKITEQYSSDLLFGIFEGCTSLDTVYPKFWEQSKYPNIDTENTNSSVKAYHNTNETVLNSIPNEYRDLWYYYSD